MSLEHNDLSQAIEKLKSGIRELNKEGRERLINSFEKVNELLQKYTERFYNDFFTSQPLPDKPTA